VNNEMDWPTAFLITGLIVACGAAFIAVVWQGALTWRARIAHAHIRDYQELVARATAAQEAT
jgi:hypothetical protein